MTVPPSLVLEFPAMLQGSIDTVHRAVSAQGRVWAQEYLQTGGFTPPQRMLPVLPGELLEVIPGVLFDATPHQARWRLHRLMSVSMSLNDGVPKEERPRMKEAFETFCLGTPWGALDHAVSPFPPWSAERMAQRLAALLRFWDVLQGPRYAYKEIDVQHTLDSLVESIYGKTMEGWCPNGPAPVREHLERTVERMARATREECLESLLRVMPVLVRANADLQNQEALGNPDFLRERLIALAPGDFESISSADRYAVNGQLYAWDKELGRR